ncbi:MAG: hypothetical protein GY702_20275 [Desulfobulbaceae bacterium]|nr:hypothetical protein [Desulfobulbaceae bacterium]
MNDQSILSNCYGCDWADYVHEAHWPVIQPPKDRPAPGSFAPPKLFFSPIAGSLPVWQPDQRRRELDRISFTKSA